MGGTTAVAFADAAKEAFLSVLSMGLRIGTIVVSMGALAVALWFPARAREHLTDLAPVGARDRLAGLIFWCVVCPSTTPT